MSEINLSFVPNDLLSQLGDFEKKVLAQKDVSITNFSEPFGASLSRVRKAHWIKSEILGKAFKFCFVTRTIIEYVTK
ncbi:hypothetical protein J4N45_10555 [Vibrio sp. SCSIO 43140]|uniref:hypothetical protein n=1 Tax=Vibrio sp. SCSIO 43140 TaxID=2819100 RepID=UPI0020755AD1|nr:hypothetical protein [Vibrio sp. SCSIO 43140]USD58971.1 hypothetical protein J4N45_10555 [Vibrio sp. SCSIO 43140]